MATVTGTNGPDYLIGTSGDDTIFGLDGGDWLTGEAGDDVLDGGPNDYFANQVDTASYFTSPSGVFVDLAAGFANDGFGGTDTLIDIEAVEDSAFDDTLLGNGDPNWFWLGAGGSNYVDAGAGQDVVFYENASSGVVINLDLEFASWAGGTDTLIGFEAVHGSLYDDVITLTNGDNYTFGRSGNDTIYGLGGNDFLVPGSGNDYVDGGAGSFDTVDYGEDALTPDGPQTQGAYVDLANGYGIDGWGYIDTLVAVETVWGSALDDTILGDGGDNGLLGFDGNDVIHGGGTGLGGFDSLDGGDGDDTVTVLGSGSVIGGQGDDLLRGEAYGDDEIDFARVDYVNDPDGILANLTATARGGLAGGDSLSGYLVADGYGTTDNVAQFHALTGSRFDDRIYVDATYENSFGNWIEIRAGAGDDLIVFDDVAVARVSYRNDGGGVLADMEAGTATDLVAGAGHIGNDVFSGANEFRGSQFADEVYGMNGDDRRIRGEGGDDHIDARGGDDRVEGDAGNDTLIGGLGNDQVSGGSGHDIIIDTGYLIEGSSASGPGKGLGHLKGKGKGHDKHDGDGTPGHAKHHNTEVMLSDDDSYAGGSGDDLFVFGVDNGHDEILDFAAGAGSPDVIDISAWGWADLAELLSHADDQGGTGDVVIRYDDDSSITLVGVMAAQLHADDFLFA